MKRVLISFFICMAVACGTVSVPDSGPEEEPGTETGPGEENLPPLLSCSFTQNLGQALTADMLYQPRGLTTTTLQCFDIDRKGNCWLSWDGTNRMMVRKYAEDGSLTQMALPTSAHGDGFTLEQTNLDGYFWTSGTLGSSPGSYSGAVADDTSVRLICRFRFEENSVKYTEDAEELFYINRNGCRVVSLDEEHDAIGCWTYDGAEQIVIYRLSELRKAGKKLFEVTRSVNKGKVLEVYDLNTIQPIARFGWNRKDVCGVSSSGSTKAVQGFCIYDGKVYVEAGAKNDAWSTISVLDFQGNILQKLEKVGVSADKQALVNLDISGDGTFEPEGVQIHQGVMYLGFVGDYSDGSGKKHSCIIRLK